MAGLPELDMTVHFARATPNALAHWSIEIIHCHIEKLRVHTILSNRQVYVHCAEEYQFVHVVGLHREHDEGNAQIARAEAGAVSRGCDTIWGDIQESRGVLAFTGEGWDEESVLRERQEDGKRWNDGKHCHLFRSSPIVGVFVLASRPRAIGHVTHSLSLLPRPQRTSIHRRWACVGFLWWPLPIPPPPLPSPSPRGLYNFFGFLVWFLCLASRQRTAGRQSKLGIDPRSYRGASDLRLQELLRQITVNNSNVIMSDVGQISGSLAGRPFSTPPQYVLVMSCDSSPGAGERTMDEATTRYEFSARMEEIAAKVEALTARMDALSPSLTRTDSQRSPPSQIRADAPTPPRPFSLASVDKGFGLSNPSPTNEGGTSAAPKGFSFFSTSARDFDLPKQSQPTTSILTPPNPGSFGKYGLFGPLPPRTGSTQSQTNISSPPPIVGTDFAVPSQSQTREDNAVPPRPSFFFPLRDSPQVPNTAQTPSPSAFAPVGTDSETMGSVGGIFLSTIPMPAAPSQSQDSRSSVHSRIIGDIPSLRRLSSLGSSGKDSDSSKNSQRMNDIAADFTQLTVKHSQAISAAISADFAELHRLSAQSATTQEIPTTSFRTERLSCKLSSDRPRTEPRISYSSYNCNNEAWIRHRLIDSKEPILFVGESKNRSLPVALAIMRESWDGVWASSLYKEETQRLPALLASAQDRSQMNAGIAFLIKKSSPWKSVPEMRHKLSELTNALDPKSHDEVAARLFLVVDATRLQTSIQSPTRNIWFQCPWISRNDNITTTAKLLEEFISSAAAIQKSGDAVFLGLTARTEYRDGYDLDNLKKVARRLGYEIFMDEWFILHAIDAGYKHESVATTDIHRLLIEYHQTFVLVKREHSEHTLVKEQISTQRKELEAHLKELQLHLWDLRAREKELSLVDEAMT
ncbi:hypothetical protein C8R44DRAFT_724665 [Mycena epipterygia]|nr:hypothetical protein C8R44DRAFT_724665 [Mycena epipterygia]